MSHYGGEPAPIGDLPLITNLKSLHNDPIYCELFPNLNAQHTCPPPNKMAVQPEPVKGHRRTRRNVWRILTFNGIIITGFVKFQAIWLIAISVILGGFWGDFLKKHIEGLFNDGVQDMPFAAQDFAFCFTVTIIIGIVMGSYVMIDYIYNRYCRPAYRRINRQRFRGYWFTAKKYDPYLNDHDWDYNSDECPCESYLYFRHKDSIADVAQLTKIRKRHTEIQPDEPKPAEPGTFLKPKRKLGLLS